MAGKACVQVPPSSVACHLDHVKVAYNYNYNPNFNSYSSWTHYARVLFNGFSSAFNTVKKHILLQKLLDLKGNGGLICESAFLSDRPQRVSSNGNEPEWAILNTGTPQAAIVSPLLCSVSTSVYLIM